MGAIEGALAGPASRRIFGNMTFGRVYNWSKDEDVEKNS